MSENKVVQDNDRWTYWVQSETASAPVQRGSQLPQLLVDGLFFTGRGDNVGWMSEKES